MTVEAFTIGDMTYILPIKPQSLTEFYMTQSINDHVDLKMKGIAPDHLTATDVEAVGANAKIEINLPGSKVPYFAGVCTNIILSYQAGLKIVEFHGKSWTYELDIAKKKRSYQKLGISYNELFTDVLKDHPEASFINSLPNTKKYNSFAVQYWETDWEFFKRIAAREGTVLVPEYADQNHKPRFWLGLPKLPTKTLTTVAHKSSSRATDTYLAVARNYDETVKENDFITYETTSYETLPLGETVEYAGKKLTIVKIISQFHKGLLESTYTLATSEKMNLAHPENRNLMSVSLAGKVLTSRGVNSKLHLDIDEQQDESTAIWFPYANETGNTFYCMPHNGETINLYFKDGYEENAIAVNGARKNGGSCKKTSNYNNRSFATEDGKEMYLSPDSVSFTVDESAADKIAISMTDGDGITIESLQQIGFSAEKKMTFQAAKDITIDSTLGMYILCAESSMLLKEGTHIVGESMVKIDGSNKADLPVMDGEMAKDMAVEVAKQALDMGLRMIPVVGQLMAVKDMYDAYKNGDYAGMAVSAIGLIPGGGAVGAVAKTAATVAISSASAIHNSSRAEA